MDRAPILLASNIQQPKILHAMSLGQTLLSIFRNGHTHRHTRIRPHTIFAVAHCIWNNYGQMLRKSNLISIVRA